MSRLKAHLSIREDAELARALGMSGSDYANRKGRGSVPWPQIVRLAVQRRVSLDALIGVGAAGAPAGPVAAEDPAPYAARAAPDCPGYRAAVAAVWGAMEEAGAALTADQVRTLTTAAEAHGMTVGDVVPLVRLVMGAPRSG